MLANEETSGSGGIWEFESSPGFGCYCDASDGADDWLYIYDAAGKVTGESEYSCATED
jgi:hypothetical protein